MATQACAARTGAVAVLALACLVGASAPAGAQEAHELPKKLANPVAAMISVPLQSNYDEKYGLDRKGDKFFINVQPVVPLTLNRDWTIISRTIVPIVSQHDLSPGAGSQNGISDVTQSLFFTPSRPTASGLIWAAGPVFLLPTASERALGARQ